MANPYREEFNKNASRSGKTVDVTTPDPVRPAPTPWTAMDVGQGLGSAAGGLVRSFNEKESALQKARSNIADATGQAVGRGINRVEQVGTDFTSGFRRGFSGPQAPDLLPSHAPNVLTQRATTAAQTFTPSNNPETQRGNELLKAYRERMGVAGNDLVTNSPQGPSQYLQTEGGSIYTNPEWLKANPDSWQARSDIARRAMEKTPEYRQMRDAEYRQAARNIPGLSFAKEYSPGAMSTTSTNLQGGQNTANQNDYNVEVLRGNQPPETVRFSQQGAQQGGQQGPFDARLAKALGLSDVVGGYKNVEQETGPEENVYGQSMVRVYDTYRNTLTGQGGFSTPQEAAMNMTFEQMQNIAAIRNGMLGGEADRYGKYAGGAADYAKGRYYDSEAGKNVDQINNPDKYRTKGTGPEYSVTKTGQVIDQNTNLPIDQYGVLNKQTGEINPVNGNRLAWALNIPQEALTGLPPEVQNALSAVQQMMNNTPPEEREGKLSVIKKNRKDLAEYLK